MVHHSAQSPWRLFVSGCGMVTIQSLGPGERLGRSWLFPPHQWHFSATTPRPTEVISFDAAALRQRAEGYLEIRAEPPGRITRTLVQRLEGTRMQLIDLYGMRPWSWKSESQGSKAERNPNDWKGLARPCEPGVQSSVP